MSAENEAIQRIEEKTLIMQLIAPQAQVWEKLAESALRAESQARIGYRPNRPKDNNQPLLPDDEGSPTPGVGRYVLVHSDMNRAERRELGHRSEASIAKRQRLSAYRMRVKRSQRQRH